MANVTIDIIQGVFTSAQKAEMIDRVTNALVAVEGEALRASISVRINEIAEGDWAVGGQKLGAMDIHNMAARNAL